MPLSVPLTGLASGILLAAVGLTFRDARRQLPRLSPGLSLLGWLAGAALLLAAVVTVSQARGPLAPPLRLAVMAAIAAPPDAHSSQPARWRGVLRSLPALALSLLSLTLLLAPFRPSLGRAYDLSDDAVAGVSVLLLTVCGGLGARSAGEALVGFREPELVGRWATDLAFAALTALVGGSVLASLLHRGVILAQSGSQAGLAGAWLAWAAAVWGPRRLPRLRAALEVIAALLLLRVALI
jgi:hypothetical protein